MRAPSVLALIFAVGCGSDPKADLRQSRPDAVMRPVTGRVLTAAAQQSESAAAKPVERREDTSRDSAFGLVHGDSTFEVSNPTLITSFPVTWEDLDASEHAGEAFAGYQASLARAKPRLREAAITVHVTNDAVLKWRDSLGAHSISTVGNYAILYVFVNPDGRTRILKDGIMSDTVILEVARKHFGIALPERPPE